MDFDSLDEDWVVWTESERKAVLAYRPDVFDSEAFPAPCLPTIYVTKGRRRRKPGVETRPTDPWFVTLYLEPEIERSPDRYETRAAAISGATELAASFAAGDVDYRSLYQVPREAYLDELDSLTGREA